MHVECHNVKTPQKAGNCQHIHLKHLASLRVGLKRTTDERLLIENDVLFQQVSSEKERAVAFRDGPMNDYRFGLRRVYCHATNLLPYRSRRLSLPIDARS